ncbi:hypothetical protein SPRG_01113 [Saprolegnia parasitica CBS 223.65]|uniref:G-protein coupled receptors family 3 profile domain-containing protein n=1 Tax=Saprolegnia parasitica (strain CBS 223.65) TaxID=695850 RepID=A0A067CWG9_SAPPC|nr:hypothetical protein SPRG_01113 [Saprolegnia parasitica CBS 223.65]KDO35049.1 hypothetical protein SPRG_01113 [Saprolegnia parasitica CBS 223.65]|eukprot:XP_012194702.1 hypothetical protein SPRG_01113 [Saprolegnia parasitica CBS 223.65]
MGSLFMISLAYLVTLPAATTYAFCSVITLVCTITVMGLMLGPKFARLNRADYKSSNTTGGNTKRTISVTSNRPSSQVSQMPMQSVKSPRDTTTQ